MMKTRLLCLLVFVTLIIGGVTTKRNILDTRWKPIEIDGRHFARLWETANPTHQATKVLPEGSRYTGAMEQQAICKSNRGAPHVTKPCATPVHGRKSIAFPSKSRLWGQMMLCD